MKVFQILQTDESVRCCRYLDLYRHLSSLSESIFKKFGVIGERILFVCLNKHPLTTEGGALNQQGRLLIFLLLGGGGAYSTGELIRQRALIQSFTVLKNMNKVP